MAGAFDDLIPTNTPISGKSGGAFDDLVPATPQRSVGSGLLRQLGLTARSALEGPAEALQVVTEPVRQLVTDPLMRMAGGTGGQPLRAAASSLADRIGLPSPENATERVVGDIVRMGASGGTLAGGAGLASALPGVTGKVAGLLASGPVGQIASAAGSGAAGGLARENGADGAGQALASMAGGVGVGLAPAIGRGIAGMASRVTAPTLTAPQLDAQISVVMDRAGADYSKVPEQARRALRAELQSSLQAGKEVDPQAVKRLADFAAVGATPTRGMVSQNPVQITREMNLAKIAANSADGELQGLPMIQNRNNQTLIDQMNALGGRSEVDGLTAGRKLVEAIGGTRDNLRTAEQTLWNEAKNSPGYKQPIYPDGLSAALKETGDEALTGYLPKQITDYMAAFQSGPGQQPFTPQHYKNLRSMLSAETAKGGNEAAAAKAAIRGLESVPMKPITNPNGLDFGAMPSTPGMAAAMRSADAAPGASIDAINRARNATRQAYAYEDSSPLVKAALSDSRTADPENLAKVFVLGGTLRDAQSVAKEVGPQGIPVIRDAIATYIKKQALGQSADETGKVSQSALNAALNKIGKEKLAVFFSPEEVQQFRTLGRVASLIQSQPVGSAVNNSNSGALLLGRGMDLLNKTPALDAVPD